MITPGPYRVNIGEISGDGWPVATLGQNTQGKTITIMSAPCRGESLGDAESDAEFVCAAMNEKWAKEQR